MSGSYKIVTPLWCGHVQRSIWGGAGKASWVFTLDQAMPLYCCFSEKEAELIEFKFVPNHTSRKVTTKFSLLHNSLFIGNHFQVFTV
jgi:hypothetical protein